MNNTTLPAHYLPKEHRLDALRGEMFHSFLRDMADQAKECRNPLVCDERFLDVLAQEYTTDFWSDGFSAEEKRNLLNKTLYLKQIKGTYAAIRLLLDSLGIAAEIKEGMNLPAADGKYMADGLYIAGDGAWTGYVVYATTPVPFWKAALLKKAVEVYAPARSKLMALVYSQLAIADGDYLANGEIAAGTIGVSNV